MPQRVFQSPRSRRTGATTCHHRHAHACLPSDMPPCRLPPPQSIPAQQTTLIAWQRAPATTLAKELAPEFATAGIHISAPQELDEPELRRRLWQVIYGLATVGWHLSLTDHLSDRQLYAYLRDHALQVPVKRSPAGSRWRRTIQVLGDGSAESRALYHRHYATAAERELWQAAHPGQSLPPAERPPHDRDRLLP